MSVRVRYAIAVAAGALLLGGIAVANAATDRPTEEAETTSNLPDGTTRNFVAGVAGSVEISRSGDALTLVRSAPNAGYAVEVEAASGREIEVQFTNGTTEVDFNAELEDGQVRVRVRDDIDDDGGPSTSTPTVPDDTVPDTTTSTVPDDDDGDVDDLDDGEVDNSGPGNVDDGDA
ncbi:MAG: hypothetical protein ACRDWD_07455, partial [Acidimicrobiia bacterium]